MIVLAHRADKITKEDPLDFPLYLSGMGKVKIKEVTVLAQEEVTDTKGYLLDFFLWLNAIGKI